MTISGPQGGFEVFYQLATSIQKQQYS